LFEINDLEVVNGFLPLKTESAIAGDMPQDNVNRRTVRVQLSAAGGILANESPAPCSLNAFL
jgi:hypothetical protein